jgi:hypothetical protein
MTIIGNQNAYDQAGLFLGGGILETYIKKLRDRKAIAAGGAKDAEGQHKKGRLTAQERIDLLFDPVRSPRSTRW